MLMADIKRGTNFWGRLHEQHTQDKSIFEGIVMHVERSYNPHFNGYIIQSLVVIVKSNNSSLIGKTQVMDFTDRQMEDFYENGNPHFVSMENLYKVLNLYNPSNYYTGVRAIYFDEEINSIPIFSLLDERTAEYAFVILNMQNGKMIQIISLMETCMTIDYENPYVWVNIVDSDSELLLNDDSTNFFSDNYVYSRTNNIFLENIESNHKLISFFNDDFVKDSSIFKTFRGVGLSCNLELNIVIFDSETKDGRICYGNGVNIKEE